MSLFCMTIITEIYLLRQILVLSNWFVSSYLTLLFIVLTTIDDTVYFNVEMWLHCIHSAGFSELSDYETDISIVSSKLDWVHVKFMQSWPAFSFSADGCSWTFICLPQIQQQPRGKSFKQCGHPGRPGTFCRPCCDTNQSTQVFYIFFPYCNSHEVKR